MTEPYPDEDAEEPTATTDYRSYEVYQRERVGESTNLVNPRDLLSDGYLADPFTMAGVLRENYPCFRDWVGNRFWLTRYDDVTSVFVDEANFESRPIRHAYGQDITGRDLGATAEVADAWVALHDEVFDRSLLRVLDRLTATRGAIDLATDFGDALAAELFGAVFGSDSRSNDMLDLLSQVKAGAGWNEQARVAGLAAHRELRQLIAAQLADRRKRPAGDLLTVFADIDARSDDVVATLIEMDLATLPASLANLWCLLLQYPEQFALVQDEPRLMKAAYLEALRHSPPIVSADRYARHEVERFGRLLPQGALVHLSGAAANRDPRQFAYADTFDITRNDLCLREPRGQYRADGLPAGIAFGHGKPSRLPAVPRDAARSRYALTRDMAVTASLSLLDRFPQAELSGEGEPTMTLDRLGGTFRCWQLPVRLH